MHIKLYQKQVYRTLKLCIAWVTKFNKVEFFNLHPQFLTAGGFFVKYGSHVVVVGEVQPHQLQTPAPAVSKGNERFCEQR